jgi:hypothetical protein
LREDVAGPVGGTLRWVPADERDGPLVEGCRMNTAGSGASAGWRWIA